MEQFFKVFSDLAKHLSELDPKIITAAVEQNQWFTPSDIRYAIMALVEKMLDEQKLTQWAENYTLPSATGKRVGIIMAGNLPLVGFADLLYVMFSGAIPIVKPSSKDKVLMDYILDYLGVERLDDNSHLDAIIATGSDSAKDFFMAKYGLTPSLLRGSKHSVAILDNDLTTKELLSLSDDVFLHNGLGCRSVSHLYIPENFDFSQLLEIFSTRKNISANYLNNYKQNKALKTLTNQEFIDGGFFTLTKGLPSDNNFLSNISYSPCPETLSTEHIQCIIGRKYHAFGSAQTPELYDYADGVDVMNFLETI